MDQLLIQPLNTLTNGQKGTIVEFKGDRRFRDRMLALGIYLGSQFEVIHNGRNCGPSLIMVEESRIALDHDMAQNILMLPAPQQQDQVWESALSRLKSIWSLR